MAISTEDSQYHSSELIKDLRTYRPKYPLPEDLRNIRTEETFCAYCGVSYLILNEIKFLEDKSENLRKELEIVKQKQGFNSLIPIGDADLPSSGEKQVSEDIERLLNEKAEITQKLDDMNTKLICYEATEKQFIKELARSQAEVSFAQEKLIELFDYSKRIRNKLKEKLFTDSLLRPIFDRINSLRDHISTLNQSYNISFTQLNNQYNQITNKLDLVTLEKDSAINKFNELELKYKEERNNWSEKQGEQLGDILVLKTKLNEETKRLDTLHDEKRQLILNFEQRIKSLEGENQSFVHENKNLKEKISSLTEQLNNQLQKYDLNERNYKEREQYLQKEMTNMSEELTSIKKTNEQLNSALETSKQEILELKTITDSQNELHRQLEIKLQEMEKELNVQQYNKELTLEKEFKLSLEKKELELQQIKSQTNRKIEQLTSEVKQKERENIVLQEEHRRIMETMKEEINQLTNSVNNSDSVRGELENQVQRYQQEVKQLYATVEKECWERDELNSVLAETREQLMKLSNSSKQSESDHRQSNQQENQKDDHLFPSISSSSVKSEQFIKHTVPKSSKTSNSNNGIARRSFQNFKNTKDTSGLAATQRQIATIISATKFRCQ
uniref:Elongation factor 2 kinase, putative n=1 Tax=Schistosoma mansoni TaxID=6183 RepID=A0A3Q0KPN1_SCHMA